MRMHHTPSYWILVVLVLLALLFALNEAHGQPQPASPSAPPLGAAAMFEGRPAMAGAQAGLGAEAGPPQGGIGVQGPQDAGRTLNLRPPSGLAQLPPAPPPEIVALAPTDRSVRPRDRGYARQQRGTARKIKRAARRTVRRAHTGTAPIDAAH